jgi:hypothetical protein
MTENGSMDIERWRKVLNITPDIDRALERDAAQVNFKAYMLWIVAMLTGFPLSIFFGIMLPDLLALALITAMWLTFLVVLSYMIVSSAIAKTTLSLARLPPEQRDTYEKLSTRTGKRIGLGWMVGFMIGMPVNIYGGIVGLPIMAFGVQLAIAIGSLNMGLQGGRGSRDTLGMGILLAATLPVVLWLESMEGYYGFMFFTVVILVSYTAIAVSNWRKASRLGASDG